MLILINLIFNTQAYLLLNHPLFLFSFFWFIPIFLFLIIYFFLFLGRDFLFLIPPHIFKVGLFTFSLLFTLSRSECLISVSSAFFRCRFIYFFIPPSIFKVGLSTFCCPLPFFWSSDCFFSFSGLLFSNFLFYLLLLLFFSSAFYSIFSLSITSLIYKSLLLTHECLRVDSFI